ncbi:hypothetical protein [Spirosoma sp. KUDC1026]|uniref:hypothetical protein n=1 Tax=Spirosoma sp. KUDC1026 TaxID=2745947 RepID=UPI00159BB4DF|nr:hypothetical protein [Spirosoma sp. KUDC1026]QKZ12305.1 hypothetical protein HU175_06560 [Spirosoma sp. KUDC1026]
MKTFYVLAILLLPVLSVSCRQPMAESTDVSADDYEVYSVFLNGVLNSLYRPPYATVVLYDSTSIHAHGLAPETTWDNYAAEGECCIYDKDTSRCRQARDNAWKPIYEELKQVTDQKHKKLAPNFTTHIPVTILSREKIQQLYKRYDDETVNIYTFHVSNIAYNTTKDKALFVSSFFCQGNCGRGELIMLKRINHHWVLIDTFQMWIS